MDRPAQGGSSSEGRTSPQHALQRGEHPWDRRVPFPRRVLDAFRAMTLDDEYGPPLGIGIGAAVVWTVANVLFVAQRLGW